MNDLTIFEADELASCEGVIEGGWRTYIAVGSALKTIRDKRLYREQYGTWEDYTTERWGHLFADKSTADRWINAADVHQNLTQISVNLNVSQANEIAQLAPDIQRAVVTIALEAAAMEGGKLTASHIRHTVNAIVDTDPQELNNGHVVQVVAQNVVERKTQSKSTYIERTQSTRVYIARNQVVEVNQRGNVTIRITVHAQELAAIDGLSVGDEVVVSVWRVESGGAA